MNELFLATLGGGNEEPVAHLFPGRDPLGDGILAPWTTLCKRLVRLNRWSGIPAEQSGADFMSRHHWTVCLDCILAALGP